MASGNPKRGKSLPCPVAAVSQPGSPRFPAAALSAGAWRRSAPAPRSTAGRETGAAPGTGEMVAREGMLYSHFKVHESEGKQMGATSQANMKH